MSGVLRAPGQQNVGGPSCSERIFQHQMIPWTQLVLGTLTQVLSGHSDRCPGRSWGTSKKGRVPEGSMLVQFSFLKIFILLWTIFKVFIEFVTILLLFDVLVFWP